jgi:hypothetical protein
MRLSEKEKKYVLVLLILVFLAGVYFFYTSIVETFLQRTEDLKTKLVVLKQEELLMNTKIERLQTITQEIETKTTDAMKIVEPFYPALPQDRLLLLVQELILKSGLQVSEILFSGETLANLDSGSQTALQPSYRLKELADQLSGNPPSVVLPDQAKAKTEYMIPSASVTITYKGIHDNIITLFKACEALNRTVTLASLSETKDPTGVLDGTFTLTFYAVQKPLVDPFMDWTLEGATNRNDLFQQIYAAPTVPGGTGATVP